MGIDPDVRVELDKLEARVRKLEHGVKGESDTEAEHAQKEPEQQDTKPESKPESTPEHTPSSPSNPVSSSGSINSLITKAKPGAIIYLKAKHYGAPRITAKPSGVVIVDGNGATVSGLRISNSKNIIFRNFIMDYKFKPSHSNWFNACTITRSSNIQIMNWTALGDKAKGTGNKVRDGYNNARAFSLRWCTDVSIISCVIKGWSWGIQISDGVRIKVFRNKITDLGHDGMQIAESTDCIVRGNLVKDWRFHVKDPNHPDGIQFWSNRKPIKWHKNLLIENNIVDIGSGNWMQGILGRQVQDCKILGNTIKTLHWNAIQVAVASGSLEVSNNLVFKTGDMSLPGNGNPMTPRIDLTRVNTQPVTVKNNQGPVLGIKPGWLVS